VIALSAHELDSKALTVLGNIGQMLATLKMFSVTV
jgi:hypothetical protein